MTKKGIYSSNCKKIARNKQEENKKAVFQYLLKHPNGATQTQISKSTHIPQSNISRIFKSLSGKKFNYGSTQYIITKNDKLYTIERYIDQSSASVSSSPKEQDRFSCKCADTSEEFREKKMLTGISAEELTSTVIAYKIKKKYLLQVTSSIRNLYGDNIITFVPYNDIIYIILNEKSKNLTQVRDSLLDLYNDSVE